MKSRHHGGSLVPYLPARRFSLHRFSHLGTSSSPNTCSAAEACPFAWQKSEKYLQNTYTNQGLKAARGLGSHLLVLIRCVTQVQWSLATPEEPVCRRVPLTQEFLAISFVTEAGLATF